MTRHGVNTSGVVFMLAAGLACGPAERTDRDMVGPPGTPGLQQQETTITGCLQEGETPGTYVLIVDDPGGPIGTTGMERERELGEPGADRVDDLGYREHAYRLVPQQDVNLTNYVGSQVRVTGWTTTQRDFPAGTTGELEWREGIRDDDLRDDAAPDAQVETDRPGTLEDGRDPTIEDDRMPRRDLGAAPAFSVTDVQRIREAC